MDVKAMAKSKRSHSQHHSKKSHPKPTPRATAEAAKAEGNLNLTSGKKAVEKPSPSWGAEAELPSNSDRYLEEDDLGSEDLLHGGTSSSQKIDVIKPKSKGADYRYLISEARSQESSTDYMDVYSSVDDFLPDLNQGFGDMLAVRGESILLCAAADYFIVDDKASTGHEASFLSLNLNTLNEQLAKVDLAQRLFIEPDILPLDLRPHKSEFKDDGKVEQIQKADEIKASETDPGAVNIPQPPIKDEKVLKEVLVTSSSVSGNEDPDGASLSAVKNKGQVKANISPNPNNGRPSFEATQAEAELDMLLDSLGQTDAPVSSHIPSLQPQSRAEIKTSKKSSGLDDATDDLLGETSHLTIQNVMQENAQVVTPAKSKGSISNGNKVDDFDSWLESL
uniref:Uncharacterized protein n=1 Tax=Kalanchoe fedtschenkoi TaxID=63787 RepID=A0A7N1A8J8_KALFE